MLGHGRVVVRRMALYVFQLIFRACRSTLRTLNARFPLIGAALTFLQHRGLCFALPKAAADEKQPDQPAMPDELQPSFADGALTNVVKDERTTSGLGSLVGPLGHIPRKKALLIGIKYANLPEGQLVGPHKDVLDMKKLLIEQYGYEEDNITMLIDADDPHQLKPTCQNMLVKIRELTMGAQPGDTFFFHYAGHSMQIENRDNSEEDGMDECLVPLDEGYIKDNTLRNYLVDHLPENCTLVAVFDTCHSGSLLDLEHSKCNAVYTPWVSKGKRRSKSLWSDIVRRHAKYPSPMGSNGQLPSPLSEPIYNQQRRSPRTGRPSPASTQKKSSIQQVLDSVPENQSTDPTTRGPLRVNTNVLVCSDAFFFDSPHRRCSSPERRFPCEGFCRDPRKQNKYQNDKLVVSLSAARDDQKSWEDRNGSSMTQALIRLLRDDPSPSFHKLLTRVSHDLHRSYIRLHEEARKYKKQWRIRAEKAKKNNRPVKEPQEVEMNNFQDPQLSSLYPLNMNDRLRL